MAMTLITGDVHCGQDYSQYSVTSRERLRKADNCIMAVSRFQLDHRNDIQEVLIPGDFCQRTGGRAANRALETSQLSTFGKGLMTHDAPVRYVAGSADPYYDPATMGQTQDEYRDYLARSLHIDPMRLNLPGLVHTMIGGTSSRIVTHGHLPEFIANPEEYTEQLLSPQSLRKLSQYEPWLQDARKSEDKHQKKGEIYEWGYRNVISKLPKMAGGNLDAIMKYLAKRGQKKLVSQMPLPEHTDYVFGHVHVPMIEQVNSTRMLNAGSLTGSFRMNALEPGTFLTIENGEPKLWKISEHGEYMEYLQR